MASARVKLPDGLDELLTSQMKHAISEANLGILDTEFANRYLIDQVTLSEIAAEFGFERSTLSKRKKIILSKVHHAASVLGMIRKTIT